MRSLGKITPQKSEKFSEIKGVTYKDLGIKFKEQVK